MKNLNKILIVALLFISCSLQAQMKESVVTIDFKDSATPFRLSVKDSSIQVNPGKEVKLVLNIDSPQYIKLQRSNIPEYIYICPGDKINVEILGEARGHLGFSGSHSEINTYLSDLKNAPAVTGIGGEEEDFINRLKSNVENSIEKLKGNSFEKGFTSLEGKRIWSKIYTSLVTYPSLRKRTEREYKPSQYYFDFVKSVLFEDQTLLYLEEYTGMMQYLVQMLAVKDIEKYDPYDYAVTTLNYVVKNIGDEKIKSHLVNFYSYDYLKRNGTERLDKVSEIFYKYVNNPAQVNLYNETIAKFDKITKGSELKEYIFWDINGNKVPLSSFKGKYVYIDMWATWCKPCIAQIPFLKKLEEEVHGMNIVFVSISTDKDAEAWKKMVVEDNMTGIQLHARERAFSNDFLVVSIPRFILIDPQGKVVEYNMTRPSDPKTSIFLHSLLK